MQENIYRTPGPPITLAEARQLIQIATDNKSTYQKESARIEAFLDWDSWSRTFRRSYIATNADADAARFWARRITDHQDHGL